MLDNNVCESERRSNPPPTSICRPSGSVWVATIQLASSACKSNLFDGCQPESIEFFNQFFFYISFSMICSCLFFYFQCMEEYMLEILPTFHSTAFLFFFLYFLPSLPVECPAILHTYFLYVSVWVCALCANCEVEDLTQRQRRRFLYANGGYTMHVCKQNKMPNEWTSLICKTILFQIKYEYRAYACLALLAVCVEQYVQRRTILLTEKKREREREVEPQPQFPIIIEFRKFK